MAVGGRGGEGGLGPDHPRDDPEDDDEDEGRDPDDEEEEDPLGEVGEGGLDSDDESEGEEADEQEQEVFPGDLFKTAEQSLEKLLEPSETVLWVSTDSLIDEPTRERAAWMSPKSDIVGVGAGAEGGQGGEASPSAKSLPVLFSPRTPLTLEVKGKTSAKKGAARFLEKRIVTMKEALSGKKKTRKIGRSSSAQDED